MAAPGIAPGPAQEPPARPTGPCLLESRRSRRRLTSVAESGARGRRKPIPREGAQLSYIPEANMVHAEFEHFSDSDDGWLADLELSDAELGDEFPDWRPDDDEDEEQEPPARSRASGSNRTPPPRRATA